MIEINLNEKPTVTIIWLHGLGADGHDFVGITDQLGLEKDAPVRFLFPHAPIRPVTLNMGMPMRAWYDILDLSISGREDRTGITTSAQLIDDIIIGENERGIATSRIFLAGFSQGAATVLYSGLRYRHRLAGIIALSGYLPFYRELPQEKNSANNETPIFWGHGVSDSIVQFSWGERSRDALVALGYEVEWHEYAMEHQVCSEELLDIGAWLQRQLNSTRPPHRVASK